MPTLPDPSAVSPSEQLRELAAIFAAGLLRLHRPIQAQEPRPSTSDPAPQKSADSLPNPLDVPGEQSVTVHVWQRLGRFDATKSDRGRFTRLLIGHAVATVLRDRKRWTSRAPASLEAMLRHPNDRPLEPIDADLTRCESDRALALDMAAVLAALPPKLRRVAEALKTQSVTATARQLGMTRTEVYRRLGELRKAFAEAGLEEYLDPSLDTSRAAGVVPL